MKKVLSTLLLFSLVFLCGCAASNNSEQGTVMPSAQSLEITSSELMEPSTPVETTFPPSLSVEEMYATFLTELCVRLNKIIVDDTHLDGFDTKEGMAGVAEIAMKGGTDMLDKIGYTIMDINEDGVSELLLLQVNELSGEICNGSRILCAYTVVDDEKVLLFEGTYRNRYYLLNDAMIYNESSGGSAYNSFGTYRLESGSSGLACIEFYFTDLDADMKPLFLRNQTGEVNAAFSEAFDGNEDAFWAIQTGFSRQITTIDIIALSSAE